MLGGGESEKVYWVDNVYNSWVDKVGDIGV